MKRSNQQPLKTGQQAPKKQKKGASAAAAAAEPPEYKCLIRATDGKRKISTAVEASDFMKFQASYALILRAHMDSLKKREKTKVKKEK
eukprot:gene2581-2883_t